MQFKNLPQTKPINRLFNIFIPLDVCCCGFSLDCAVLAIIVFQASLAVSYLFVGLNRILNIILVIFYLSVQVVLIEAILICLVYNGVKGLKTKRNF